MLEAVRKVAYNLSFAQAKFEDGYYKLSIHLQVDNNKEGVFQKQINFHRYLGLPGSADNKIGDPFKKKRFDKILDRLSQICNIIFMVSITVIIFLAFLKEFL